MSTPNVTNLKAHLKIEFEDAVSPFVFSVLFGRIMYYILHMKNQIPYPLCHLRVLAKRELERVTNPSVEENNFILDKKRKCEINAISAFTALDQIQANLLEELNAGIVEEIVLIVGSSVVLARDVYRFVLSSSLLNQNEGRHNNYDETLTKALKYVNECADLQNILKLTYSPMKMFLLLKRRNNLPLCSHSNHKGWLERLSDLNLNPMKCLATIEFNTKPSCQLSKCPSFSVFEDSPSPDHKNNKPTYNEEKSVWYQSSVSISGFKVCKMK